MKRQLTCIICPRGCALTAAICGQDVQVEGNACPKGAEYARSECLNPVRTVTATVRVANRPDTMASVKTEMPVPKERMFDVMQMLRRCAVQAPVAIGDTVLEDVFGTKVIITKAVE